jgi:hypothetical protein
MKAGRGAVKRSKLQRRNREGRGDSGNADLKFDDQGPACALDPRGRRRRGQPGFAVVMFVVPMWTMLRYLTGIVDGTFGLRSCVCGVSRASVYGFEEDGTRNRPLRGSAGCHPAESRRSGPAPGRWRSWLGIQLTCSILSIFDASVSLVLFILFISVALRIRLHAER